MVKRSINILRGRDGAGDHDVNCATGFVKNCGNDSKFAKAKERFNTPPYYLTRKEQSPL